MAHAPAMTQSTAGMVVPCIVGSFLDDSGLKVDLSKIAAASPGKATLGAIVKECGIKVVYNLREKLEAVEWLYLACDKANKNNDNFFC